MSQGLTPAEVEVVEQGEALLRSVAFDRLRSNASRGLASEARIGEYTVVFEPGLPIAYSAMTLFGERGFVFGPSALTSPAELYLTVMQELYRLNFSTMLPCEVLQSAARRQTKLVRHVNLRHVPFLAPNLRVSEMLDGRPV